MVISPSGSRPCRRHAKYDRLIADAKQVPPATTIVVHPCDETSLRGACRGRGSGHHRPGPGRAEGQNQRSGAPSTMSISARFEIVDAAHSEDAAALGVKLIHEGKGELLMKGSLHTDELMRAVTASATGLRTARRISHVFIMDVPTYREPLFITDAAINIFPDLDAKRDIVQNAIDLFTACRAWHAASRHSVRRRDGDVENSLDHRSGRVVQNGRARPDHRRHSRWATRFR